MGHHLEGGGFPKIEGYHKIIGWVLWTGNSKKLKWMMKTGGTPMTSQKPPDGWWCQLSRLGGSCSAWRCPKMGHPWASWFFPYGSMNTPFMVLWIPSFRPMNTPEGKKPKINHMIMDGLLNGTTPAKDVKDDFRVPKWVPKWVPKYLRKPWVWINVDQWAARSIYKPHQPQLFYHHKP